MGLFTRRSQDNTAASSVATLPVDPALAALTGDYVIDPAHSSIGFTVRHAMVTNVRAPSPTTRAACTWTAPTPPAPPPPST